MSRIGKKEIPIPNNVKVDIIENNITVEGPLGKLKREIHYLISVKIEDGKIKVIRNNNSKLARSLHGLTRTLISNMVEGVTKGFSKTLIVYGIGYKTIMEGNRLNLQVGRSHPVYIDPPDGVKITVPEMNKIVVSGADKELVGEVAANIRKWHPPEPYIRKPEPRKGIFYEGEKVRLKVGKSGA
ncbi:MAG: 50S ribosomal protein L6 [bacterium]